MWGNVSVSGVQLTALQAAVDGDALCSLPRIWTPPPRLLQVKDKDGRWVNVDLRGDEVAVLLGATLHHCTAGLLRPSLYRVVRSTPVVRISGTYCPRS